jgi:hypothetical protein
MFRPGLSDAPPPGLPPIPVTPEMYASLLAALASGVTDVKYADREVKYASAADLLKAISFLSRLLYGGQPVRSVAYFAKGLPPTSPAWACGAEHAQYPAPSPADNYRDPDLRMPPPRVVPPVIG